LNKKFHYHVIYISSSKEQLLADFMKRHLEEGQGTAFVPRMEYYRRGDKAVKIREMFKGYVFVYSTLNIRELHFLIRRYRRELDAGLRELALRERATGDPTYPYREYKTADTDLGTGSSCKGIDVPAKEGDEIGSLYKSPESLVKGSNASEDKDIPVSSEASKEGLYELSDITAEEERFLDTLREGDGLLGMSSGYRDGTQIVVMEGPLKDYEDCIDCVDAHNRKAFLAFMLNGRQAQAGFNCRPKTDWFPEQ
jgi:transcription antitermination factor NusG